MAKLQQIDFTFESRDDFQQAIYCPFTGKPIISTDPGEGYDDFPETVMLAFVDGVNDLIHVDASFQHFEENILALESVGDLELFVKQLDVQSSFLLMTISYEGNNPSDFSQGTFLLRITETLD